MSSKINLQTCEYARKSSIFQDNQLILWKLYTKHDIRIKAVVAVMKLLLDRNLFSGEALTYK